MFQQYQNCSTENVKKFKKKKDRKKAKQKPIYLQLHRYHFVSAKLFKLIQKCILLFAASSECRNLVCTYNNKSRHTLFRMFPIGKFNHIHRHFSWRDQNVSGINSICSICLRGACWTACAALIWSILPVKKCWLLIQLRDGPGGTNHAGPMAFSSLCQKNEGLTDTVYLRQKQIVLNWSCRSDDDFDLIFMPKLSRLRARFAFHSQPFTHNLCCI